MFVYHSPFSILHRSIYPYLDSDRYITTSPLRILIIRRHPYPQPLRSYTAIPPTHRKMRQDLEARRFIGRFRVGAFLRKWKVWGDQGGPVC